MFTDPQVENALKFNDSIPISSLIIAEFNLNDQENIEVIGNYYHEPDFPAVTQYYLDDFGGSYEVSDLSFEEYRVTDEPITFTVDDKSPKYFYSLGDCFLPFRPRSGINKARFSSGKFIDNVRSAERPRYYMPSKKDYFKYWSSYAKGGGSGGEQGISGRTPWVDGKYPIINAAPFVVYNESIFANRIVVKMQTNVGTLDMGTTRTADDDYIDDPLYDYQYASVPSTWSIEVLDGNDDWIQAASFVPADTRSDLSPIVPKDGHVELFYGIVVPNAYIENFEFLGYINETMLPASGNTGDAYIYGADFANEGTLAVWDGATWDTSAAEYGWQLLEDVHIKRNGNVMQPVYPPYIDIGFVRTYREIQEIRGIRVLVTTMNAPDTCFDLIEMSPRLSVDLSDNTTDFTMTKLLSGSDNGLPVGSLAATNGSITLANIDDVFTDANAASILGGKMHKNIKFCFYEVMDVSGIKKYIPLKTLYSDSFATPVSALEDVQIPLRDLYFRLETTNSPSVLYKDTRLTYAVAALLDSIGISNYIFRSLDNEDPIIPYFFVEKNVGVAEILQRLAVATQSAMFFDEYNNFVVMTKEYLLPNAGERTTDIVLSGNDGAELPNIESIEPGETLILNNGTIGYTVRYVQREVSTLGSVASLDSERLYRYKPVLLWEVSANDETKTINESVKASSGYALGAMALNAEISDLIPEVVGGVIINNVMSFGESIYWLPRFQGYLYANAEIIRFDAVQYAVPGHGLVWISDNAEYQRYFAELPFNGKIYPTGQVRIYAEPFYDMVGPAAVLRDGPVKSHGRAQFDTQIAYHPAGLDGYWSNADNTYGVRMYSSSLFSTTPTEDLSIPMVGGGIRFPAGTENTIARRSTRNGIIKNFMASKVYEDGAVNRMSTTGLGTVQSSALIFRGPRPDPNIPVHRDLVSYVYKDLSANAAFQHFGTRMRIIGKADQNFGQVANGSSNYYAIQALSAEDSVAVNGGSGGLGIMIDPSNGSGYYLEIAALSEANIESYSSMTDANGRETVVHNIIFYKVNTQVRVDDATDAPAQPQKLWGGLTNIVVDSGLFAGQDRLAVAENNSVYDLAIEYERLPGGAINFYLFINNILVKIVKDRNPLQVRTSMALFVRASTECMFENIYAIEDVKARGQNSTLADVNDTFDSNGVTTNEFMSKYAVAGMIQSAYLSNISSSNPLGMRLFFDEFGTIMREAAHFDIDYDQAFPAFYAKIAPTFTLDRSFVVSKFYGGAYNAEFLIFNSADKAIVLDETTGSYLRILGVTFTQNSTGNLTVDDYYGALSNASDPQYDNNYLISPESAKKDFNRIKASRSKYGDRQFSMDSMYIQSREQAEQLMQWMIDKTLRPRQSLTITTFPMPNVQVGDMVTVSYTADYDYIDPSKQFIVAEITYSRRLGEIQQVMKVVEI